MAANQSLVPDEIQMMTEAEVLREVAAQFKGAHGDRYRAAAAALEAKDAEIKALTESYRCYHCGIRFTDGEAASRHFGTMTNDAPLCQADKMLIVIARKERDEYAEIRANLLAEIEKLRRLLTEARQYVWSAASDDEDAETLRLTADLLEAIDAANEQKGDA